jgi:hypothetical protein
MKSLLTVSKAQKEIQASTKAGRLAMGLTQAGLATRAGVNLPTSFLWFWIGWKPL